MKVVILAGGMGTRISEETDLKPKPMVEIGGKPIIWHIMKLYSHYGFNDFIICCGYKGYMLKEYFANYYLHESDVTFDFSKDGGMKVHNNTAEKWKVTLVNTGLETMTGGRIKRIKDYVKNDTFMMTYGDGLSNVNIGDLVKYHESHGKFATVTAVRPAGRFGSLIIHSDGNVDKFQEKTEGENSWINGGFFVFQPEVIDFIESDKTLFEKEPLENLSKRDQLRAFKHSDFWQSMDTIREKNLLDQMWRNGSALWKVWEK